MIGPNGNITGIARSTYHTSRANGSKAARARLRFRRKILERKSSVKGLTIATLYVSVSKYNSSLLLIPPQWIIAANIDST